MLGQRTAGAVSLTDDSLKRRKIALIGDGADREGLQLLSPTHYLRQALSPVADLIDGGLSDVVPANPDVIILADVATLTQPETDALLDWLDKGGLLLRFAGPRLAASEAQPQRRGCADAGAAARRRARSGRRDELGRGEDAGPLCRRLALSRAGWCPPM